MPTNAIFIRKLVDRLVTLPSSQKGMFEKPEDERNAVRTELGRALTRNCQSDDEAAEVVDRLMEGTFRPSPGEIREAADAIKRAERLAKETPVPAPDEECQCGGSGWRVDSRIVTDDRGFKAVESSPARRCDCARGRFFAAKDREREREAAAK